MDPGSRPDIVSDLIWAQTVCKGYQQTTLIGILRVKGLCLQCQVIHAESSLFGRRKRDLFRFRTCSENNTFNVMFLMHGLIFLLR